MATETTKKLSPIAYDTRVIDRNLADGSVAREEYERHLAALPDVTGKSESFLTRLSGHDYDEPEGDDVDDQGDEA